MVRLIDRLDMTLAVDWDLNHKTTTDNVIDLPFTLLNTFG